MRTINYGLIVSDFDGTLICEDGTFPQKNKEKILEYIQAGGIFAISTGRLPMAVLKRARELGIQGVISCGHGSVIVDIESEKILFDGSMPNAVAVKICKKMESMGLHVQAHLPWEYYANKNGVELQFYQKATHSQAKLVLEQPLSEFLEKQGCNVAKMLAIVAAEENDAIMRALVAENFENCHVTRGAATLVEVVNAQYSKGTALQFLAEHYHVPIEKTIAIGDQLNDISMIEVAGLGIAVQNADKGLKERAAMVSDYTNEEGAVGEIIEEYGFNH